MFIPHSSDLVIVFCITVGLLVIILLLTRLGSVPINLEMKTWNTFIPPPNYKAKMDTWDLYNAVRTFAAIAGFVCLVISNQLENRMKAD